MLSSNNNSSFSGTLGEKDSVEFKEEDVYTISTTEIPLDDLYLKDYVGSKYTGNSWDTLNDKVYDSAMFDTFESTGVYPQDLLGLQTALNESTFQVTISSVNKSNSVTLIPYATYSNSNLSAVKDTTYKYTSKSDRTLSVVNVNIKDVLSSNDYSEPDNFDNTAYRGFVEEYYLQLSDDESMQSIKEIFQEYLDTYNLDFDTFNAKADIPTKIDYITNFLCSTCEYTLSPGKTPLGNDFVLYFLSTSKKGYCSHFASAGAVLCRMLDIPARYVEGYYVDKNSFDSSTYDGSNYNVTIKDSCGHAWVEVYIDNVGWVKRDFTPGFNGNPTMADFTNSESSDSPTDYTEIADTEVETLPVDTQIVDVTETPTDVTTTPTDITTTISAETDNSKIEHKPLLSDKALKTLKHIFVVLLMCALAVGCIVLRRYYVLQNRTANISSEESTKSVLASYRYITQVLKYLGFERKESMPYMKFAKEVSSNLDTLETNSSLIQVMEVVLKAELSNDAPTEEEKAMVSEFAYALANTTYASKSKFEKLIVKYILCLV
jgi:transglutaminase-like putative cysteine protease